jgi:hypothetical protein
MLTPIPYNPYLRIPFHPKTTTMRVLLDIKDSEAVHLMRVLRSLPYLKELNISAEKEELVEEIKEAVENLKLVREGKLKARPARELLDEL